MALSVNETILIRVVFRDWEDDDDGFGDPIDPDTVEVTVYSGADFDVVETTATAIQEDVGIYYYEFSSLVAGNFKVEFVGTFSDGSTNSVASTIAVDTEVTETYLGYNYEVVFISDFDLLLVDPEEFAFIYPEVDLVDIAILVQKYSLEVQSIFGVLDEYPLSAYEYIRAATECALSRSYGFGQTGEDFTLGDLSISNTTGKTPATRAGAKTPCELAAALRQEMMRTARGMKAVVTGVNYKRKIPSRHLKHAERGF